MDQRVNRLESALDEFEVEWRGRTRVRGNLVYESLVHALEPFSDVPEELRECVLATRVTQQSAALVAVQEQVCALGLSFARRLDRAFEDLNAASLPPPGITEMDRAQSSPERVT